VSEQPQYIWTWATPTGCNYFRDYFNKEHPCNAPEEPPEDYYEDDTQDDSDDEFDYYERMNHD
jgi:hypothetical protein